MVTICFEQAYFVNNNEFKSNIKFIPGENIWFLFLLFYVAEEI